MVGMRDIAEPSFWQDTTLRTYLPQGSASWRIQKVQNTTTSWGLRIQNVCYLGQHIAFPSPKTHGRHCSSHKGTCIQSISKIPQSRNISNTIQKFERLRANSLLWVSEYQNAVLPLESEWKLPWPTTLVFCIPATMDLHGCYQGLSSALSGVWTIWTTAATALSA